MITKNKALDTQWNHLLDGDCGVVGQVSLDIESKEEVDLLLAPELGRHLSCGDDLLLFGAAINE